MPQSRKNKIFGGEQPTKRAQKIIVDYTFGRVILFSGISFAMAAVILCRAFYLQMGNDAKLEELGSRQHDGKITYQAPRGSIADRNGVELAVSIPMASAYVNPKKISHPKSLTKQLAPVLHLSKKKIMNALTAPRYFSWLKRQIPPKELAQVQAIIPDGLGVIEESRRFYPHRQLAAHVLGFVGAEGVGLDGIEHRYERILTGGERVFGVRRDAHGRAIDVVGLLPQSQDLSGHHLILTLDRNIQYIAERELEATVKKSKAKAGSVVILEPKTGEILALANYPRFDPNVFSEADVGARKNRVITDVFEPGSCFKVFVIGGALDLGLIKPTDSIFCENGSYRVKRETIHDVEAKGWLAIPDVLKYSSNIGAFKISEKYSSHALYEMIQAFGFGEKTGVELSGESRGIVQPPKEWHGVTQGNIGFGQGIAVTPLQLARAYAVLANGGDLLQPHLVKAVVDDRGHALYAPPVRRIRQGILTSETLGRMTEMMVRVTEKGGTGEAAQVPGFRVAGKTGTSQKTLSSGGYSKEHYVSSFIGFLPAERPELVIAVMIDEPQGTYYGGMIAAPTFSRIATQSLNYLGIEPGHELLAKYKLGKDKTIASEKTAEDWPLTGSALRKYLRNLKVPTVVEEAPVLTSTSNNDPAATNDDTPDPQIVGAMPDLRGLALREALSKLEIQNLSFRVIGYGFVYDQNPQPGSKIGHSKECVLYARPVSSQRSNTGVSQPLRDKNKKARAALDS